MQSAVVKASMKNNNSDTFPDYISDFSRKEDLSTETIDTK